MIKRTIKETISEYDKDGNLVRQTVTETSEDDDTQYIPHPATFISKDNPSPWWAGGPTCTCSNDKSEVTSE